MPLRVWESWGGSRNPSVCRARPVGGMVKGKRAPLIQEVLRGADTSSQSLYCLPRPGQELAAPAESGGTLQDIVLAPGTTQRAPSFQNLLSWLLHFHSTPRSPAHWLTGPLKPASPSPLTRAPSGPAFWRPVVPQVPVIYSCSRVTPPQRGPGEVLLPRHLRHNCMSLCSRVLCDHGVYTSPAALG